MKLKLYMNLRDIAGKDELEMELGKPLPLTELLREVSTTYGDKMKKFLLKGYFNNPLYGKSILPRWAPANFSSSDTLSGTKLCPMLSLH
jgi:hypothetical protein